MLTKSDYGSCIQMKVVLITGGSRGIGASTARACAKAGIGVIITYCHHADAALEVVQAINDEGGLAVALQLDLRNTQSFSTFKMQLQEALVEYWQKSTLNYLVNNAGFGLFNPIEAVTEQQFDDLYQVHLKGPFFLTQSLFPMLETQGHIINITSATSRVATAGVAPYAAFKGGLEVLTRYMAKEFADRSIRANSIAPGAIRTELGGGINAEFETLLAGQAALGRIGEPDDIGDLIAGLFSEKFRWINAQNIEASGGYLI